ncbi:DNA cytosine methyltransferase [Mycoplasma sp. 246B]
MKKIGITSLFASAGIGTYLLKNIGFDVTLSNELIAKRAYIHDFLYPNSKMIIGDISNKNVFDSLVLRHKQLNNQILIATPPCQGMSLAGRRKIDDPRNLLITYVVDFIKQTNPKLIIIENVIQMYTTKIMINNKLVNIQEYLKNELSSLYQHIDFYKLNSKDFDTAQDRKRAVIIISNLDIQIPHPTKIKTVEEVIGHLPSLESGQRSDIKYHNASVHNDRHIEWMKHTPSGKSAHFNEKYFPIKKNGERIKGYSTTYKRISWDKPAPTITMANGSISSQNNVHPGRYKDGFYSDARVLTIKEILLLTGLPDDFVLPDDVSDSNIRHIIGECVPPKIFYGILKENKDKFISDNHLVINKFFTAR